jgi:hypothetical protein
MSDTKQCPFCGEQILDIAVKCKHCHSNLGVGDQASAQEIIPLDKKTNPDHVFPELVSLCELILEFLDKKTDDVISIVDTGLEGVVIHLTDARILYSDIVSDINAAHGIGFEIVFSANSGSQHDKFLTFKKSSTKKFIYRREPRHEFEFYTSYCGHNAREAAALVSAILINVCGKKESDFIRFENLDDWDIKSSASSSSVKKPSKAPYKLALIVLLALGGYIFFPRDKEPAVTEVATSATSTSTTEERSPAPQAVPQKAQQVTQGQQTPVAEPGSVTFPPDTYSFFVVSSQEWSDKFKNLLASDYESFVQDIATASPMEKVGPYWFGQGMQPHSGGDAASAFTIDQEGKLVALHKTEDGTKIYGVSDQTQLPEPLKQLGW